MYYSGGHLQSLASKIQSFRVKPGERRLYRGSGHSFAGGEQRKEEEEEEEEEEMRVVVLLILKCPGEVNTRGLNGDTKYSIFDTC